MAPTPTSLAYTFTIEFQRILATAASCRPKLYTRGLHKLDPDSFSDPIAKLLITACKVISVDTKKGPDATSIVAQRLRSWMADGRVTQESFDSCVEILMDTEDKLPSDAAILGEVLPIIKKRLGREVLEEGIDTIKNKKSYSKLAKKFEEIDALGTEAVTDGGMVLGAGAFAEIADLQNLSFLPTGIPELDSVLGGGLWRGGIGIWLGGSGSGKSMALTHVAGVAYEHGLFAGVVTLEIGRPLWLARLVANITRIPIDQITQGYRLLEAKQKLAATNTGGRVVVAEMTASVSTVDDVIAWVEAIEESSGREMDLLTIDYADRLGVKGGKATSTYQAGLETIEGLRLYCAKRKKFCWTASQSQRKSEKKKIVDMDDVADSVNKVRCADLVLALTPESDGMGNRTLTYNITKNRTGDGCRLVGPLPTNFPCGRLVG